MKPKKEPLVWGITSKWTLAYSLMILVSFGLMTFGFAWDSRTAQYEALEER